MCVVNVLSSGDPPGASAVPLWDMAGLRPAGARMDWRPHLKIEAILSLCLFLTFFLFWSIRA